MFSSPIAAVATPVGQGALCVLRVSGTGAVEVVEKVWRGKSLLSQVPARVLALGKIIGADGHIIDEVLAVRFAAPASFTGEEVVEITGHGGPLVARLLLDALLAAGAEPAGPGEFSQRAFLNGKLDLAQAEAVMDIISAQTTLALRAAHQQLSGGLSATVDALRDEVIGLLAHVEAYIDFPDEDIDPDTGNAMLARIDAALASTAALLATAERGRILRHGLRLVIAGAPNAGKSSLLNRLLGFDRAIVSAEAGTTRDTVEETIDLGGVPVRLIDTAGLRDAHGSIEHLGIERTRAALRDADFVLEVVDATLDSAMVFRVEPGPDAPHHLLVLNKADLGVHPGWAAWPGAVAMSCLTGHGIDQLVEAVQREVRTSAADIDNTPLAINARHQHCLRQAADGLTSARALLAAAEPPEIVAEELRAAMHAVGGITGKIDAEEILGVIFGSFCIGK